MDEACIMVKGVWKYLYCAVTKGFTVELCKAKHLNNSFEQRHTAVMQNSRLTLGFKSFCAAANVLAG